MRAIGTEGRADARECVCNDGEGFYARPCRCGRQKVLTAAMAAVYGQEVGTRAKLASYAPNDERRLRRESDH